MAKSSKERQRDTRLRRLAKGLCGRCGKEKPVTSTMCEACREKTREYARTYNEKYKIGAA